MSKILVLDASAILALLYGEPGAAVVAQAVLDKSRPLLISAVNLCEVATKLTAGGATKQEVATTIDPFLEYVANFDSEQALLAAELSRLTRPLGLSLGDRACLALAALCGATAVTADSAWKRLNLKVPVELLRNPPA